VIHFNVYSEDERTLALEWVNEGRRLSLFVRADGIEFLKSWGGSIHPQMEGGEALGDEHLDELWGWICD